MPCNAVLLIVFATLFFNRFTSVYIKTKYVVSFKTSIEKLCHKMKLFKVLFYFKYLLIIF